MATTDATTGSSRIFISYRREDSDIWVGRLADELCKHFPAEQIFRDIASIDPGADFVSALEQALASAAAMLVVIGPGWLSATDRQGRRRLDSSNDFVRQEVGESLRRAAVRVFPLLVNSAQMPADEDLPEPLKPLARRQAFELTARHWTNDIAQFVLALKRVPGLSDTDAREAAEAIARLPTAQEAQPREPEERAAKEEAQQVAAAEKARRRADEEALHKLRAAHEAKRREAEERAAKEEAQRVAAAEEARRRADEKARRTAEAEARRISEEEVRHRAAEEASKPSDASSRPTRLVWISIMTSCVLASVLMSVGIVGVYASARTATGKASDAVLVMWASLLVMVMVPSLALFCGGLVRTKNIVSLLARIMVTFSMVAVLWFIYGYSLAWTEGNRFFGGFDRLFLSGAFIDASTGKSAMAATFSKGVAIPELVFFAYQASVAGLACCMIVAALAERIKFSALLLFVVLWFTLAYAPIAHMVWFWVGPDAYSTASVVDAMNAKAGLVWQWGALDSAGGFVVLISSAVAGLIGAILVGKPVGYGKDDSMATSPTHMIAGASFLWIGWFGLNAGSALEAGNTAVLAATNTFLATPAAILAWCFGERLLNGRASIQGAAQGALAGLAAITPAARNVGMIGAIVIGLVAGFACLWGINALKRKFEADDALDFFGVLGVGGVVGAVLTGVFNNQSLGGPGTVTDLVAPTVESIDIGALVWIQLKAVLLTMVWSAAISLVAYKVIAFTVGLRVADDLAGRTP